MKRATFCTCDDTSCLLNPSNHDQGCDLCVQDSLITKEIPKCFFLATTVSDTKCNKHAEKHRIAKVQKVEVVKSVRHQML